MADHHPLPSALSATASATSATDLTPELREVHALQARVNQLRARDAELTERIERDLCEREEVRTTLRETEAKLETAVLAPMPGGVDPTAWLPDEIMLMILVRVLVGGTCGMVCRRWHAVCVGATAKKHAWQWRWAGYTHGGVLPRTMASHVKPLAVGSNGKLYGGGNGGVQVWSTVTNTHLQTLEGHTDWVYALVVGPDGTVFSGSGDKTVRIWSGEDRSHLETLRGHTMSVRALAVGTDGTLYSGSDKTIRVWTFGWGGSRLVRTLQGHTDKVWSLAVGKDATLYSGSWDTTIRVWSAVDGSHLRTLVGHTNRVRVVVVAADGTIYSGASDHTLRTWSGLDGSPIRTLQMEGTAMTIAIGVGNTVLIGDFRGGVSVWDGGAAPTRTLYTFTSGVNRMAIGQAGQIFTRCKDDSQVYVL